MPVWLATTIMSKALKPFILQQPGIEVTLVEWPSEEFRFLLEHNEIHLAVGARRFSEPFRIRPLPPIPILVVSPADHPFRNRNSIELDEVVAQPLLLLRRGFLTREVFESACQLRHVIPNVRHESQSVHTLLSLVDARFGVAVIPGNADIGAKFASLLQDGRQVAIETAAAWNPHAHLPPETSALIDSLEELMQRKFENLRRDVA